MWCWLTTSSNSRKMAEYIYKVNLVGTKPVVYSTTRNHCVSSDQLKCLSVGSVSKRSTWMTFVSATSGRRYSLRSHAVQRVSFLLRATNSARSQLLHLHESDLFLKLLQPFPWCFLNFFEHHLLWISSSTMIVIFRTLVWPNIQTEVQQQLFYLCVWSLSQWRHHGWCHPVR